MAGFFFREEVEPKPEELLGKKMTPTETLNVARRSLAVLESAAEMATETVEPAMRALVDELGLSAGQVFGILRVAVTGQAISPPLFESMAIIGRDKVLQRVRRAIAVLERMV
jgi:glutamyl-tRNA synthetase